MATEKPALSNDTVRDALREAMEGTIGVKNPKDPVLDQARQVALDAADFLRGEDGSVDSERFSELDEGLDADLRAWLLELPSFLSKKGREEQGHELCALYAPLLGPAYLDAERAVVLLEAGKKKEAREHLDRSREEHGDHIWLLLRGAFVAEASGDVRVALRDYERALEVAREGDDKDNLRFAYDGLVNFHQNRGENNKAVALSKQMLEDLPELEEEFRTEQIVNEEPKTGRNDPCPCGSGKKYKKCCGRV